MLRRFRCPLRGLICGLGLLVYGPVLSAVPEHELKLAMTYRVAKFVSWPAHRAAFVLCVYPHNPFDSALDGVRGRLVKDIPIEPLVVESIDAIRATCDLVFVPESNAGEIPGLIEELGGRPILTLSDAQGFAENGGMVELVRRDNRLGFVINVSAYERAGLSINSQLLQLATLVQNR